LARVVQGRSLRDGNGVLQVRVSIREQGIIQRHMTYSYFITYFVILFVATITPGPSMLLAMNHGVNHGMGRTVYSGLGNLVGNLLMALVSMLGLGAVLAASGVVFNVIKWLGIGYLAFIGIKLMMEPITEGGKASDENGRRTGGQRKTRLFVDGLIIALGNPKGILFFTALFPQFIHAKEASVGAFLVILVTLGIVAFGCYMLYAFFGERLRSLFRLVSFRKAFNRVTGSLFVGSGIALAFSKK
jgi:homoserine/homoserine lactone efflux protein